MNVGLQRHTIERKLRNRGINPDKVDLKSLIDKSLRLPENIRNIEKNLGINLDEQSRGFRSKAKKAEKRNREFSKKRLKQQAREVHRRRPDFNRLIDESLNNDRRLKASKENLKKWRRNPDKYDFTGVDTKLDKARRTDATIPANRVNRLKKIAKAEQELGRKIVSYDFVTPTEKEIIAEDFMEMRKSKLKSEPPKTRASELLEGDWRGAVAKQIDKNDTKKPGTSSYNLEFSGSGKTLDKKKKKVAASGKQVRNLY